MRKIKAAISSSPRPSVFPVSPAHEFGVSLSAHWPPSPESVAVCYSRWRDSEVTGLVLDDQGWRVDRRRGHGGGFRWSVLDRRRLPLERVLKHLLDPAHRMYLEAVLDFVADLDQILDVLFGDQHLPDATA